MKKNVSDLLKKPINICGGWCSICELFIRDVCDCQSNKTGIVSGCLIKKCTEGMGVPCYKCKEFPCKIIKRIQKSRPKDSRFYVRHLWIDNIKYLKKYGEERYKKRLLADKKMRTYPYNTRSNRNCTCKYCKNPLKIDLKKD